MKHHIETSSKSQSTILLSKVDPPHYLCNLTQRNVLALNTVPTSHIYADKRLTSKDYLHLSSDGTSFSFPGQLWGVRAYVHHGITHRSRTGFPASLNARPVFDKRDCRASTRREEHRRELTGTRTWSSNRQCHFSHRLIDSTTACMSIRRRPGTGLKWLVSG